LSCLESIQNIIKKNYHDAQKIHRKENRIKVDLKY